MPTWWLDFEGAIRHNLQRWYSENESYLTVVEVLGVEEVINSGKIETEVTYRTADGNVLVMSYIGGLIDLVKRLR